MARKARALCRAQAVPSSPLAEQSFERPGAILRSGEGGQRRERFHKGSENTVHAAQCP